MQRSVHQPQCKHPPVIMRRSGHLVRGRMHDPDKTVYSHSNHFLWRINPNTYTHTVGYIDIKRCGCVSSWIKGLTSAPAASHTDIKGRLVCQYTKASLFDELGSSLLGIAGWECVAVSYFYCCLYASNQSFHNIKWHPSCEWNLLNTEWILQFICVAFTL